jgi:hypothetical protein
MKTDLVFLGRHINIASRTRRRWLVALIYAAITLLAFAWSFFFFRRSTPILGSLIIIAIVFVINSLGGRNEKGGLLPPFEIADERELHRRDHAHYLAYRFWDLSLLPALLAAALKSLLLPVISSPALRSLLIQLPYGLLVAAGVLYYTLPQAILLCSEPDMEPEA